MSKVLKADYSTEAVKGFSHRTAMEEAARCLLCLDAPCSKGCPAGTDPGKFIRSIRFRNVKGAAETIRENNILGGACAHICPYDRLCEEECSRCGIDRPIEIGKLQRYVIEQEKNLNMKILNASENKKSQKVVCVGAGPASLACASELARAGYDVTIIEKEEKAGGVLTYGIVPSRLPEEVVEHDLNQVKGLGVRFIFNKEATKEDLVGYDAIFLGVGLWEPKIPDIEGKDLKNVFSAVSFLKEARIKKDNFKFGDNVIVVGGGDVAVDCAVTAKLLGAKNVRIVYRRTLEEAPANIGELHYVLSLGIGIVTEMAPSAITGTDTVEQAIFTGRDGISEARFKADAVVFAIGQAAADMTGLTSVQLNEKGGVMASPEGKTNKAGIFAAGDIVNGGKTAVEAVAEGKKAAASIMEYLNKKGEK